ncbi:MAG: diguanylate cyclase [Proteobacteria bacterium]|nr:diguanylate cyclase [Pseudomonadota bacterium]MBU1585824.1 diguanylate cyclase [Pseudomonadota bacterium]MBU2455528.1 diguanylate cyclase [Pseudomonadota bacterium]MBU2630183.1 diguanylate cyclase [Pseudomonadota bacterium]
MKDIRILFVDHHEEILTSLALQLQAESFLKTFVNSAKEALQIILTQDVHVIVCDLMINDMDGLALLQLIKKQYPHIIRLAFSDGKNILKIMRSINNTDIFRYIEKPIDKESLIKTLQDAVTQFFLNRDKAQLILQLSQKNEELKYLALHDDLTGLYNIRFLYQDLKIRIKALNRKFSVIFMDMDNFKKVVDAYGHLNGSQALKEVAATLQAAISEPAYGVAYGGDEFVIILPDFDKQMALEKSREIQTLMSRTTYLSEKGYQVKLKASYGIATFPEDAEDLPKLLAKADTLMFDVKKKGKNAIGV